MKTTELIKLVMLAAIWGSSYLFMKIITPAAGMTTTIAARIVIGTAGLLVFALFIRKLPDLRKHWLPYTILGASNLVIPTLLIVYAIMQLNASLGAILNATTPLFTMIVARIWLKERFTLNKIAGMILGVAGLSVLLGWMSIPFNFHTISAIGSSILAALSYSIANVYTRKKFSGKNPIKTAGGQLAGATVLIIPVLISGYTPVTWSASLVIPMVILGLICTAAGFIIYFQLIAKAGPVNTSMVTILVPVFSLLWSNIFLDEAITASTLAGLALIMTGLYLITNPVPVTQMLMSRIRYNKSRFTPPQTIHEYGLCQDCTHHK